jgi:arabinogalactan endo-1,4-beta-galactosidase
MRKITQTLIRYLSFGLLFLTLMTSQSTVSAQFVKGADIGWLQQMEATGCYFYDSTGVQMDCLQILQDHGINTVRFRVWVNPSDDKINGHCSKKEVATMALRAKNRGMRIMIDFHYSDSWADPGKQNKPAAWANHSFNQLLTDVYDYTYQVLDTLKSIGATPNWVQIGNEITNGILWPDGNTSNWSQLAQLLNKGYDATKAVDNSIKVVLHIDQGEDNVRFRTFFDMAMVQNVRYDVIGASYYPFWEGEDYTQTIINLGLNLNNMAAMYGKDVMVVEVGGDYTKAKDTYDMLIDVLNTVRAVPDNKGLGVIYWEPEGVKLWSNYELSCWGTDWKPTVALDAFMVNSLGVNSIQNEKGLIIYPNPYSGGLLNVELKGMSGLSDLKIFDMTGRIVKELTLNNQRKALLELDFQPGVYFIEVMNEGREILDKLVIN